MRFFKLDWWRGERDDDYDPVADHARHLGAIRDRLPPALVDVHQIVPLHDSRLRELVVLPAAGTVRVILDGGERFTLIYSQVERFESTAGPKVGRGGPDGYGDLGYGELDVLPGGAFEHRLLFSSGIELAIAFRHFEFERAALPPAKR